MSRKKLILSILLLILLVIIGIILPAVWKHQNQQTKTEKETAKSDDEASHKKTNPGKWEFLDFEKLSDFLPDTQIQDLKEQLPTYLEQRKETEMKSITFLPEETTYPDKQTTVFMFQLSSADTFPVTYSASTGVFLFGKEKLPISTEVKTYPKETDDSLPPITTEEIETRQEGGFPDTKNDAGHPADSKDMPKQEAESKEVQP
ncbi:MAG: DUF5038 domain-containing protein [Eubacteriales bacterium]|nr:DUF5038 domain-containing protein [Eubacteriales bacterium]